jgi:hypothetical protein
MCFLARRVELSFDVTIQRPHHAHPGEHRRTATLGDQQKRFHRGLPFCGIVFGLGELGDVQRGVAQGDELLTRGQSDWIRKMVGPKTPTNVFPRASLLLEA